MSSLPPDDPLVRLWQTAPRPDTHQLMQDLQRLNRLHRRLNRCVFWIMCGIAVLLVFEEATGGIATHGMLSAVWILGLAAGVARHRRDRCSRQDALSLDTVSLLKYMIARAKTDLNTARCLYAGVAGGAIAGAYAMKFINPGAPAPAIGIDSRLHLIQKAAGAAVLIIMMVTGAVLARARSRQVRELTQKLRSMEADL
jgi:hypothetical protein